ncbi:MAG: hypothetical protein GY765_41220 [bacterium]|nr:hypothetical protein [bacterium]
MRSKKLSKNLFLKKQTVSNLSELDLEQINGGKITDSSFATVSNLAQVCATRYFGCTAVCPLAV